MSVCIVDNKFDFNLSRKKCRFCTYTMSCILVIFLTSVLFPLGSCLAAGFTECCRGESSSCLGTPTLDCYCDRNCYSLGDCCDDIDEICPELTELQPGKLIALRIGGGLDSLPVWCQQQGGGPADSSSLRGLPPTLNPGHRPADSVMLLYWSMQGQLQQCFNGHI